MEKLPERAPSPVPAFTTIGGEFMSTIPSLPPVQRSFNVPPLIAAMLKSREHVSDLIFSPGRPRDTELESTH